MLFSCCTQKQSYVPVAYGVYHQTFPRNSSTKLKDRKSSTKTNSEKSSRLSKVSDNSNENSKNRGTSELSSSFTEFSDLPSQKPEEIVKPVSLINVSTL